MTIYLDELLMKFKCQLKKKKTFSLYLCLRLCSEQSVFRSCDWRPFHLKQLLKFEHVRCVKHMLFLKCICLWLIVIVKLCFHVELIVWRIDQQIHFLDCSHWMQYIFLLLFTFIRKHILCRNSIRIVRMDDILLIKHSPGNYSKLDK